MTAKLPAFDVFSVLGDGKEAEWTRIGAGWNHTNQEGINVVLSAHPIGRKIVLMPYKAKEKSEGQPTGRRPDDDIPF